MKRTERSPDSLQRPDGNSLKENYKHHDDAAERFFALLPDDIDVYPLGIDERDDDGGLIYDDEPDFLLSGDGGGALVDIKSKTSDEWMRLLNERHYDKYRDKAVEYDVPAYVFFYNTSNHDTILCRCDGDGRVFTTSRHDFMLPFFDRNNAAYMTTGTDVEWTDFLTQIQVDG
jgi:hypothetical protein